MSKATASAPRKRRRFRVATVLAALVLLAALSLLIPPIFRFALREALTLVAWRRGVDFSAEKMAGSLFRPVTFTNARVQYRSRSGATTRVEASQAVAEFAWSDLFSPSGGRWFRGLTLSKVNGVLDLPVVSESDPDEPPIRTPGRLGDGDSSWAFPDRIAATEVTAAIQCNGDFVRAEGARVTVSAFEPGEIQIPQLVVKQPWLSKTFRDVHGATAVQNGQVLLANVKLQPGMEVQSLSAELNELLHGRWSVAGQVAAFGGTIRTQARMQPEGRRISIDATTMFSDIGVAPLATFFALSDAAGGTIKEGTLTFRGSSRTLAKASASLRLKATNFQWESRQWDSLVLGAALLERRLQVPELELHQGHNQLSLNGELALPQPGVAWWQSEFLMNVTARIENLTELSALVLPEFTYAAGKMSIDGSVRGKNQQFNGAIMLSGSGITWRNAPIEDLHAALRLNGNELQVAYLELLNKDDFVRGRGVVNILGAKQYWGELRASIQDLSAYSALMQKPILSEPLGGGAVVNWSGEGSAKAHSGRLYARLQKLRTLGATARMMHPVNANIEGTYADEAVQFSRFAVSDDESSLTANVSIGEKMVNLHGIRLEHGKDLWLQGDAELPVNLWKAWPNASLDTLLADQTPAKLNLKATNLHLREASQLTGWKWPLAGVVNGEIKAEGVLSALNTQGQLKLENASFPLWWNAEALTSVNADLQLAGQSLKLNGFTATHSSGEYRAAGEVNFKNPRDPLFHLSLESEHVAIPAFRGIQFTVLSDASELGTRELRAMDHVDASGILTATVEGPASAALVKGDLRNLSISAGGAVDTTSVWLNRTLTELPAVVSLADSPLKTWRFDLNCWQAPPEADPAGAAPTLRLTGSGADLVVAGSLDVSAIPTRTLLGPLRNEQALVTFRETAPRNPSIDFAAVGELNGRDFKASVTGPCSYAIRLIECEPPLTDDTVRAALTAAAATRSGKEADALPLRNESPVVGAPRATNPSASASAPVQSKATQ